MDLLLLLLSALFILQDQVHCRKAFAGNKSYEVVYPQKVHTQYKRDTGGIYPDIVHYELTVDGKKIVMHLQRAQDLTVDNYSETFYLPNGEAVTSSVPAKNHCYYQGRIKQDNDSLISISTCNGLSGYFRSTAQGYVIKPLQHTDDGEHAVYKYEELENVPKKCSVHSTANQTQIMLQAFESQNPEQQELLNEMKYIELYVAADYSMYRKYKNELNLKKRIFEILNYVNVLYKPLNISMVLIGIEIWNIGDWIHISRTANVLKEFSDLRWGKLIRLFPNDFSVLITNLDFDIGVGLAYLGAMCDSSNSIALIKDHNEDAIEIGTTLAHEIGHALGMHHDSVKCLCLSGACIMEEFGGPILPYEFSSCSLKNFKDFILSKSSKCLRNKPSNIKGISVCGNKLVDVGEECDCGSPEECSNPCCNATTCILTPGSMCSYGECCEDCQIKKTGIVCRAAKDECDIADFCDGVFARCPGDQFRINGFPCKNNQSYCFHGECPTLQEECIAQWGENAQLAKQECFNINTVGKYYGYCKKEEHTFFPCEIKDKLCGKLFCYGGNSYPKYGKLVTFSNATCKTAVADPFWKGPETAKNGIKCGEAKICLDGKCESIDTNWMDCEEDCDGHAVCNNYKQCVCKEGWLPPFCEDPVEP